MEYIAATGCQWAQLPKDFPPFTRWPASSGPRGYDAGNKSKGASDSQSVKAAETGGITS